jgi:hypothetical protein
MEWGILILLLLGLGLIGRLLVRRRRLKAPEPAGGSAVDKAKADIEKLGWHIVGVKGQGGPGFLFTIGLWKSYKHPEILLFAPSEDPSNMANPLVALVKQVAAGETLKSGDLLGKVFRDQEGAVRDVLRQWLSSFMGTAGGVYGNWDFPVIQVYWPDKAGLFPWQSGFNPDLYPLQPVLYQDNLVLANVGYDEARRIIEQQSDKVLEASLDDLFVKVAGADEDLTEAWRWRVGPKAALLHLTIFGDAFFRTPDGHIHWLDTGSDLYEDIATDRESWLRAICGLPAVFFHASTLLHARSLQYLPQAGEVYDWIHSPMLGGEDKVDNLQLLSARVHVASTGCLAQSASNQSC